MAYKINNTVTIGDDRAVSFANVTIQNNGFLEVNSSDGFQGTVAGYTSGAFGLGSTVIDKFPFSTDTNATDVGDCIINSSSPAGQSSTTHGYNSGADTTGANQVNTIQKFPFAVDTNASDVGDLTFRKTGASGQSSTTHGYTTGGFGGSVGEPTESDVIEKFPFSVDTNSTDVGDLTQGRQVCSGQSSSTSGYAAGGSAPGFTNPLNVIDKFPFSTDTNATDVGDLTQARARVSGQSSTTHGYSSGGIIPSPNTPPIVNTIEKFPFASDTNATDIGDLTLIKRDSAGQSSTVSGYTSAGLTPTDTNVIDKFPFSSDTNATDVGDLTVARNRCAGQQD